EQMPEAVIVLDANGRVTAMNQLARDWSLEEDDVDAFSNRRSFQLCRPSGEVVPTAERPVVRALLQNEATFGEEFLLVRKSGESCPILLSAAPIRNKAGETIGATASARDITQLKELENRRKEWATIVAHDLKQPVSVIALSAQALQRKDLSA